jgi:sodium/proline symporter
MSTADSQLLASSSAFASDIYKTTIRKKASDKEMLWVGRFAVAFVVIVALFIALFGSSDIMSLVSAAWSIFGAALGPVIILALFWRRLNYKGAVSGIITGFVVSIAWMICCNLEYYISASSLIYNTGLYEIVPGFVAGLIVTIVVSLCTKAPSSEVTQLFDSVRKVKIDVKKS